MEEVLKKANLVEIDLERPRLSRDQKGDERLKAEKKRREEYFYSLFIYPRNILPKSIKRWNQFILFLNVTFNFFSFVLY